MLVTYRQNNFSGLKYKYLFFSFTPLHEGWLDFGDVGWVHLGLSPDFQLGWVCSKYLLREPRVKGQWLFRRCFSWLWQKPKRASQLSKASVQVTPANTFCPRISLYQLPKQRAGKSTLPIMRP